MILGFLKPVAAIVGALSVDGKAIGMLTLYKGEQVVVRLTCTNPDHSRADLTGAAISFKVRRFPGDANPAVITKIIGAGIILGNQANADTKGTADITIAPADIAAIAGGIYSCDVLVTLAAVPFLVVKPTPVTIADTDQ